MNNLMNDVRKNSRPVILTIDVYTTAKRDTLWRCRHMELYQRDATIETFLADCRSVPTAERIVIAYLPEKQHTILDKKKDGGWIESTSTYSEEEGEEK